MLEVQFTPSTRVLTGLDAIGRYLHVSRRTAFRWVHEHCLPAMQTPAGTWITTTSLVDLWIVAASQVRWARQKRGPLPDEAPTVDKIMGEDGTL
jgi:hypothetical protein